MFVTQAHSLRQQAKLAVTLAWVAGYTNILTVIICGVATSHVTGTTANIGRDLAFGDHAAAAALGSIVLAFLLGAVASGVCTEISRRRKWESIYVLPMALEAGLLFLLVLLFEIVGEPRRDETGLATGFHPWLVILTAAAAMGLQNATATRISTGVVRTTHVTGVLTDLGLDIAQFFMNIRAKWRTLGVLKPAKRIGAILADPATKRLALLSLVIGGYALGAGLGCLAHIHLARGAFIPPVLFLSLLIWQDLKRPIAEIDPVQVVDAEPGFTLPPGLGLYHLHKNRTRQGQLHRMPNLLAWLENLPDDDRVVILDLGRDAQMDGNAAIELGRVVLRARQIGKKVILAGLSGEHARKVRQTNRDLIQFGDICPDVDLAIAHAIVHLEDWDANMETIL